jgi:site-specific DNA-methyltransferase (adenine-specific)
MVPLTKVRVNALYYGDNLTVLRESIARESIDLIYLDPPFNSQASYNVLFRSTSGEDSQAQIHAFEDTWRWGQEAERAFDEVIGSWNTDAAELLRALRAFLKENDMMAYLTMMAVRMLELHRVLKPTGSLYLHCDSTASHYLKLMMDAIFGPTLFRNEVIWKRTSAHNDPKKWGRVHDTLLFYAKGETNIWNQLFMEYDPAYLEMFLDSVDEKGVRYKRSDLTGAGTSQGDSGKQWRGIDVTSKGRHWATPDAMIEEFVGKKAAATLSTQQKLDLLDERKRIHWPEKEDGMPRLKQYVEDLPGVPLQDVITDIRPLHNLAAERLGYPTQKPLALLERIIAASSNEGDVVLDPFCGCGTTIHAAQKLKREWIGIDVTHLAISLIEKRLNDAFPGIKYEVHGTPKDLEGARALAAQDKYQFQWWAVSLVNAVPFGGKKKGADSGIDGLIYFKPEGKATEKAIVSVKGGDNVNVAMVRDLAHVVDREKAKIGVFITLADSTGPMRTEAVKAGYYETIYGKYPKIQILTLADLFEGKKPNIPLVDSSSFKKAAREDEGGDQDKLPF